MNDDIASTVADFLAHKRALGRKYLTEEATLRLLVADAALHDVADLHQLTPAIMDTLIAARPRPRARSFNHLVGTLGCFLDWAVVQQRLERVAVAQDPATGDGTAPALPLRRCSGS